MLSTSSIRSSSKSTSWLSSSCSSSACLSSASRSPALPRHSPFSFPSGRCDVSFHLMISIGHNLYLSSLPGIFRTCFVTSLTCNKIHGIRLSVGIAFRTLSPSRTSSLFLDRAVGFLSVPVFGCNVQTMTRRPFGSAIKTTIAMAAMPSLLRPWLAFRRTLELLLAAVAVTTGSSCSVAITGLNPPSSSSSELSSLAGSKPGGGRIPGGSRASSSSSLSSFAARSAASPPSTSSTMTMSP
mmetsp:Transcript_95669/g.180113  ORF Transcript_95669/g.180113 Transcript_95669/m.180113 type:complete len:240 (-) Transcript_95669:150-869(-)